MCRMLDEMRYLSALVLAKVQPDATVSIRLKTALLDVVGALSKCHASVTDESIQSVRPPIADGVAHLYNTRCPVMCQYVPLTSRQ